MHRSGDSYPDYGRSRDDFVPDVLNKDDEAYELQELYSHRRHHEDPDHDEPGGGGNSGARRLSSSTVASFQLYTPDEEQIVVRKFDRRLVVFLSACYMMSFLDRSSMCTKGTCCFAPSSPSKGKFH